jgi:hypothetical protein
MTGSATQRQKIFDLLKSRAGTWVPCYEVAALALQYSTRVKEIRESGTIIHNKIQWVDGIRHSWFMLIEPEPIKKPGDSSQPPLFTHMPERHVDCG